MADRKKIIELLFAGENITGQRVALRDEFLRNEANAKAFDTIIENIDLLMVKWKHDNRVNEIIQQPVRILNATVGKPYETSFDPERFNWQDVASFVFEQLEEVGLRYDVNTKQIMGVPLKSGDFKALFKFKLADEPEDAPYHEKLIPLIINPDPKSLWKNLPSDRNDPYWKEDDATVFTAIGDRYLLGSSKRGRSHANAGSFREDDFAYTVLESGWTLIAVADGAGSAKYSRKGSFIACNAVIEYFTQESAESSLSGFDELLQQRDELEDGVKKLNQFVYNKLGGAALFVHKKLEAFASENELPLKDLNTTLIFTLFKKVSSGYTILSFGVGDCPIAFLNKDLSNVTLMNWLDVGDYGGGTRFITMPEIFQNEKFSTRIGFKLVDDFSYLMMMSDGIYDAKFIVETNLADIRKWNDLMADLGGRNEDKIKVELNPENKEIVQQFSAWMDFWSQGNHDDRTLVIVF